MEKQEAPKIMAEAD